MAIFRVQNLEKFEPQFREIISKALDKTSFAEVVAPGVADTEFVVDHGLGFIPLGFLVISKDRATDVYLSATPATESMIFLRSTAASAVLRILVF